jgi:hypothetical protein
MNRIPPRIRNLAERLMAHETRSRKPSQGSILAFELIEKLRPRLENLMGRGGFHALLSRARALSVSQESWLESLLVHEGSLLGKSAEPLAGADPVGTLEGRAVLAQLLALLEAFIGEILMLRLIHETWPKLPPDRAGRGEKHEE